MIRRDSLWRVGFCYRGWLIFHLDCFHPVLFDRARAAAIEFAAAFVLMPNA